MKYVMVRSANRSNAMSQRLEGKVAAVTGASNQESEMMRAVRAGRRAKGRPRHRLAIEQPPRDLGAPSALRRYPEGSCLNHAQFALGEIDYGGHERGRSLGLQGLHVDRETVLYV